MLPDKDESNALVAAPEASQKESFSSVSCGLELQQGKITECELLLKTLLSEKASEASLKRIYTAAGKDRDVAFAELRNAQYKHISLLSKHEKIQEQLKQKATMIKLIQDAYLKAKIVNNATNNVEFENNEDNEEELLEALQVTEANLEREKNGVGIGLKTNEVTANSTGEVLRGTGENLMHNNGEKTLQEKQCVSSAMLGEGKNDKKTGVCSNEAPTNTVQESEIQCVTLAVPLKCSNRKRGFSSNDSLTHPVVVSPARTTTRKKS